MPLSSNRRDFIKTLSAGAVYATAGSALSATSTAVMSSSKPNTDVRSGGGFRFVFMPCVHFRPEYGASEGFAMALKAATQLDPKPDLIVTGGDLCHNLRDRTVDESEKLFDEFEAVLSGAGDVLVRHCIGNHDLAGWSKPEEFGNDPRYGKAMFKQKLGLDKTWYSFDHGGWHFIMLDYLNVVKPGEFSPELDAEQLEWLAADVKSADKPTLIVSHAPPVSAVELFTDRAKRDDQNWTVPYGRVIKNTPEILKAVEGGNVKAFLSGHLHMVEDLEFLGHRFICSGSVSGQQWTGPREEKTQEGFGILDCGSDGSLSFKYQDYGWQNRPE